ncbi:MAG: reverse transcriptase domain-containing protein, partial [Aeromonas sp.]
SFFEKITRTLDEGFSAVIFYLDIHKAFDRVPHERLIQKLVQLGIVNPLLSWLRSFLDNRFQITDINGVLSEPLPMTSGVVQGSVLGPLLFLLYINDISKIIKFGSMSLYADDCKILYKLPRCPEPQDFEVIHRELQELGNWAETWQLKFSVQKCHALPIRCDLSSTSFYLHDEKINSVSNVTDLGIIYSNDLSFSRHTATQIAKASRSWGRITRFIVNPHARLILYKAIIRPCLEYGINLQSFLSFSDRYKLESFQRRITRTLQNTSSGSYRERCLKWNIEPLWLRRLKLNLVILFTLIHNMSSISDDVLLINQNPAYKTRNCDNRLVVPRSRTKIRSNFFIIKYLKIWNLLPNSIRMIRNKFTFKKALDMFFTNARLLTITSPYTSIDTLYEKGNDQI